MRDRDPKGQRVTKKRKKSREVSYLGQVLRNWKDWRQKRRDTSDSKTHRFVLTDLHVKQHKCKIKWDHAYPGAHRASRKPSRVNTTLSWINNEIFMERP